MAQTKLRLNFNLRDPNADKPTPINLIVRYNNQKFTYPTNESILPKYWQNDKTKGNSYQRAKQTSSFPEFPEFNAILDNIESTANNIFRRYHTENNNEAPTWNKFKELLDIALKRTDAPAKGLIPFIKSYISTDDLTDPNTGRRLNIRTIKKYKTTLKHLEAYVSDRGKNIDFEDIDRNFRDTYMRFLRAKYNHSNNTVGKEFAVLKKLINEATARGLNKNLAYKTFLKTISEKSDSIYLDKQELDLLYKLDLSNEKHLDRIRDQFLIGCWTGLRFSDFIRVGKEHINGDFIEIEAYKTKEMVAVPIHPIVRGILAKYDYKLPRGLSNQKTNKYIKEVGKKIKELQVKVPKKITKGGIQQITEHEKWELITTHTARRSFATNLIESKFPAIQIMKITGHRTESAFMRYIKHTPKQVAQSLKEHWEKEVSI